MRTIAEHIARASRERARFGAGYHNGKVKAPRHATRARKCSSTKTGLCAAPLAAAPSGPRHQESS